MKINQIYFSPTGSTEKVVKLISDVWDNQENEKIDLDFSLRNKNYALYSFEKQDLCIIGVPAFGGRVPAVALERLKQMKASGTPTILIATFGNRDYDDTLLELKNTVQEEGFHVIAAIASVTEHSIMHQFGTGRPDESDKKELLEYANKIKHSLDENHDLNDINLEGSLTYRKYDGVPFKPSANKNCNNCGICSKLCPVGAIPANNPSETLKDVCISCMRCISVCPQHARKLNSAMLFIAGKNLEKKCSAKKKNELYIKTK